MEINSDYSQQQFKINNNPRINNFLEETQKITGDKNNSTERLKEVAQEFSSIFIKKMLSSMRDTLPEEKLFDGGFAEDIFQDMLDEEISKMGANREAFARLNNKLYEQLEQSHLQNQEIMEQKGK